MSDITPHNIQDCIFASSKNQVFVNSSGIIVSSTEAAARLLWRHAEQEQTTKPTKVSQYTNNNKSENYRQTSRLSPEQVEKIVAENEARKNVVGGGQERNENLQSDLPAPKSITTMAAPPISGKQISIFFPDFDIKQLGAIQPSELVHPTTPQEASKWIYTCCHALQQEDGSTLNVLYLQDVEELKEEYNTLSRAPPVALDSIKKKKISLETPDFILEDKVKYGDLLSLRISSNGVVLEQFPLSPTFLTIPRNQITGNSIMGLIDPLDHVILHQGLSECFSNGTSYMVLRWRASTESWVRIKSSKSVNDTLVLSILQIGSATESSQDVLQDSVKMVSDAWSFFSSSVASMQSTTAPTLSRMFSVKASSLESTAEETADRKLSSSSNPADPKM